MKKIKVGIIGCGTIGSEMAHACQTRLKNSVDLVGICDLVEKKAQLLRKSLKDKTSVLELDDLVKRSSLIVEAAAAGISADVLKKAISGKKDVLIMSIGGLLGKPAG
jgi:aspartate dehydrogenase